MLFSQNFISFYRPPENFWTAVSVFVPWKTAFFVAKTNFHFIFSEIQNSYAEKSAVFAEFHEFLSSPKKFLDRSYRICLLKNCFFLNQNRLLFYFFWNKKFICRKKCCFRRISWVFRADQKNNFDQQFPYFPQKTAFFEVKTGFHFIFSEKKNSYAEKKCCFRSQNRYPKPSWCVSFQESAIFAAIWGQIKN